MASPHTLVLLPGLDGTGKLFAPLVQALPPHLTPQVVSYPGDEPLDYAALKARVAAELPKGRPFVLVGESFSGPLALELAATSPPGLAAVVLVASFHRQPTSPLLALLQPLVGAPLFSIPLPRALLRKLLAGGDAPDALVDELKDALGTVRADVLAGRAKAATTVDASAAARACPVPVLYLHADQDGLVRKEVLDELKALLPKLEVSTFPTPHLILQRQPKEAAAIIAAFIERVAAK